MSIELKVNASLLKKVEDQLRNPEKPLPKFDMRMWLGTENMGILAPTPDTIESLEASGYCGTIACLAGHVIVMAKAFKKVTQTEGWVRASLHSIFPEIAEWGSYPDFNPKFEAYSRLYSLWAQLTQTSNWWGVNGLANITEEMAADVIRYIRLQGDMPGHYGVVLGFFKQNPRKVYRRRVSK